MNDRKTSRWHTSLVALVLAVALVSCGRSSSRTQPDTINIGVDLPVSVLPDFSARIQNGLSMAANEINDAGGIGGSPIRLVFYDDAFSDSMALNNIGHLIRDEDVVAVIGPADTNSIEATIPLCQQNQVVQVIATGASELVDSAQHPYLFRIGPVDVDQASVIVSYAVQHADKIAIVADDTLYGRTGIALLEEEMGRLGTEPVVVQVFSYGDTDMTAQARGVVDAGADGVILWGVGDEPAYVTSALRASGWEGKIIGTIGLSLLEYRKRAQDDAEGVVFVSLGIRGWAMDRQARPYIFDEPSHASFVLETWMEWQERYWTLFGEERFWGDDGLEPQGRSAYADEALISNVNEYLSYVTMYALKEAIVQAGTAVDGARIREALEQVSVRGAWSHDFRFSPDNHDALNVHDLVLLEYRDGFVEPISPAE